MAISKLLLPLLLALQLLAVVTCENCPPAEDIFPCLCESSKRGIIDIGCSGGDWQGVGASFDHLRGKSINNVLLENVTGHRMPSQLFRNTRVDLLFMEACDLEGLSDVDGRPPFGGLEDSLKVLFVITSVKGVNKLSSLNLAHLKQLQHLFLEENNMQEVRDDWFDSSPNSLEAVIIKDCGLSKIGDMAFAHFANLRTLDLTSNPIKLFKRTMLPQPATKFQVLNLRSLGLTRLPDDMFSGMPSLYDVQLASNGIRRLEEATWSPEWEKLTFLNISLNPIECDSHMEWMFKLKQPYFIDGRCSSPDDQIGVKLSEFIDSGRKIMSVWSGMFLRTRSSGFRRSDQYRIINIH